jgi:hypothetical protein
MNRTMLALSLAALVAAPLRAQAPAAAQVPVAVDLSPRGQIDMNVQARGANNRNVVIGKLSISYGQPSAQGRPVAGGLIPTGEVWRFGANAATSFRTDVDLMIGDARVPKGEYTLYSIQTATGAQLIVNKQTGQWGTTYDQAQDLVRIPLTVETLHQPIETFTLWLIPAAQVVNGALQGQGAAGQLRAAWGTVQYSVGWRAAQ